LPEDRDALVAGFERLSPESRYRRFFTAVTQLSEQQLDYLTQVDHRDHEALVAIAEQTGEGIGVARFVRIEARSAEPAVVVLDDWQRRGAAGQLLDALAQRAREEGIRRFIAPVLAENTAAIAALQRLGAMDREPHGAEVEVTVDLTEASRARWLLHDLLGTVASGVLEPARGLWERLLRGVPPPDGFGRSIVVGIDESEHCAFAARCAGELASTLGLGVHLVAAYRPLLDDRAAIEAGLEDARRRLTARGVEVEVHLQRGDPSLSILYAALRERAGMIILGSPPPDTIDGLATTSVWSAVAHNAQCDVLIARRPMPRAET
jgi:nucleotide-binding universal stress UspA family protein/RimJ/RimL family protein N-acetyltransferase